MSSLISSMERWTGAFLSWLYMTAPKTMPRTQTRMPAMSRLWPDWPKKVATDASLRLGTLRVASPPGVCSCAWAIPQTTVKKTKNEKRKQLERTERVRRVGLVGRVGLISERFCCEPGMGGGVLRLERVSGEW